MKSKRPKVQNKKRITKESMAIGALLFPETGYPKPKTRADCAGVARPCPYVSCRHNLYLDIKRNGAILTNFPDREPWDMPPGESCSLDVAECGDHTQAEVGRLMDLTDSRVGHLEKQALANCEAAGLELSDGQ